MRAELQRDGVMASSTTKNGDAPAHGEEPRVSGAVAQLHASGVPLSLREDERAALRPAVATVESDVARLEAQQDLNGYAQAAEQLATSWHALVSFMALGTAPELRACPHCGHRILVKATRCVQCWKQSDAA